MKGRAETRDQRPETRDESETDARSLVRRFVTPAATLAALLAVVCVAIPALSEAQQQPSADSRLRAQQDSLDRLRQERTDLQQRMEALQGSAHTIAEELSNLTEQMTATEQLVRGLDAQLQFATQQVDSYTVGLARAEDQLAANRAILQRRLIDIYKRGPLNTIEVMLSAQSFGDLIARYRWLHLLALRDKSLVKSVADLREQIAAQRESRVQFQQQVEQTREDRADEEAKLEQLTAEQQRQLKRVQGEAAAAQQRLATINRDESRMNSIIATLIADRARTAATAPAVRGASASALRAGANLDWPVDSRTLLFAYGPYKGPGGTELRWNGIGIGAPVGTPVRAIAAARVDSVAPHFATFGTVVILDHPGAGLTIYGSLGRVDVKKGDIVDRGQVIGTVGVSDPTIGPHLYFEVRGVSGSESLDPLTILKPR